MKQDTIDFLSTLLSLADDPDRGEDRPFMGKTVYDFSPAFQAGAEKFVDAFREYLESEGFGHLVRAGERSFGGNVYFSLSGHGGGFFDDNDERVSNLQNVIEEWSVDAQSRNHRFEELESDIEVGLDGKIDLCVIPEAIEECRAALFAVPPPPEKREPEGGHVFIFGSLPRLKCNEDESNKIDIETATGDKAASVFCWPDERVGDSKYLSHEDAKRAAVLFSSAPDLLSALEGVMTWWREVPLPDGGKVDEMPADIFDAALNAISKAKGN